MLLLFLVDGLRQKSLEIRGDEANTVAVAIRIPSDRKLPERVEFDTSTRNAAAAAEVAEAHVTDVVPGAPVQAPEREAFAMLQPGKAEPLQSSPVKPQVVRAKGQRQAKRRLKPHRSLFAQRQLPQGWFGNVMW